MGLIITPQVLENWVCFTIRTNGCRQDNCIKIMIVLPKILGDLVILNYLSLAENEESCFNVLKLQQALKLIIESVTCIFLPERTQTRWFCVLGFPFYVIKKVEVNARVC